MSHDLDFSTGEVRDPRLIANPGDPWVSVHAIAEYAFCPRAGLLAYENKRADDDDEPPAFDILPRFELEAIEKALVEKKKEFAKLLYVFLGLAFGGTIAGNLQQPAILVLIGVGMVFLSYRILRLAWDVVELLKRRQQALSSRCLEPDPYSKDMQPVNWFGLLNLGFQSERQQDSLRDPDWRFDGRPWRILRRGSLTIPVFRTRSSQESPRNQQIAKIMAYCRLASVCFGAKCPYGIILTGEDYSGFAIPNEKPYQTWFHESLVAVRQLALAAENRSEGIVPPNERACVGCPLGEPRPVSLGLRVHRFGAPVPVRHIGRSDGKDYHCDCGDRFEWTPPHERSRWF